MRRHLSPVAARYLLARLRPLTRPVFWAPSIALMLVILFTWQYWMRPEWVSYFSVNSSSDSENGVSPEDRAIGADIDTLPLLFNDFKLSPNSASDQPDLAKPSPITPSDLGNLPKIPIAGSGTIAQSQPLSLSGSSNGGNAFSGTMPQFGYPANGSTNNLLVGGEQSAVTSTQPQTTTRSLGFSAIGTYTDSLGQAVTKDSSLPDLSVTANNRPPQTPSSFTPIAPAAPIEGTTSLGGFGVNAAPTTNSYTNSYTSIVEGTQSPGATAVPLVAPSIAPISPSPSLGQSSLSPQLNSPGLNAAPSPFLPQQPQTLTNDVPFTAPRPIPGRVLGGGQINTFSNP